MINFVCIDKLKKFTCCKDPGLFKATFLKFQTNSDSKRMGVAKQPPKLSRNIIEDIINFFLSSPIKSTLARYRNSKDRLELNQNILQWIGKDTSQYSILNVHKIGIDVPVKNIFEELLQWNGDSSCWPNHIVKIERVNDKIEYIRVLLFGQKRYPFNLQNGFLGLKYVPLFEMNAQKIQAVSDAEKADDARYILYNCSGGYPIGFFAMYVRPSLASDQGTEQSQLFLMVGFDFFGTKKWTHKHIIVRIWSLIHNRVTGNVLARIKQLSEWRFNKLRNS